MPGSNSIDSFNKRELKKIREALNKLPKEFSLTRRRTILKQGLKPFINAAISKAPSKSGDLKLSIDTKTFRNNKKYVFGGVVTKKKIRIGGSVGSEKLDAFYAKWIEFGFTHIAWPKDGEEVKNVDKSRLKEIEPSPFIRPAWDATRVQVRKRTEQIVEKRIKAYERKVKRDSRN